MINPDEMLKKLDIAEEGLRNIEIYVNRLEQERDSWRAVAEGHNCGETLAARTEERETLRADRDGWRSRCLDAENVFVQLEAALKKIIATMRVENGAQVLSAPAHHEAILIAQEVLKSER